MSRTTVSFVLNNVPGMRISEATCRRVTEAARRLNYHPDATARHMAIGRTHLIGFVLRQRQDQALADRCLPQVLAGLSRASSDQGYRVLFEAIPAENGDGGLPRLIRERYVDGIVLSGPRSGDQELHQIHGEGAKVVLMGQLPGTGIPFVDVDNVGGARLATQHLVGLGYGRIALITNAPPAFTAGVDRMTGYRLALEGAGIQYDASLVRYGAFTPESGRAAMNELLSLTARPDAVFVASDAVALGALQAIRELRLRVPADIALVGFDDVPLAEFLDPPLTTVRLPAYGLGWGAAELLVRLISAEEEVRNPEVILETELVVRESCGARLKRTAQ